jgi:hypothetical protein
VTSIAGKELRALEALRFRHASGDEQRRIADEKRGLVRRLARATLRSARDVERLHEALCFLRAFPDDAALLREVERALAGFAERRDLARHREALADSGIAGTPIRFAFFAPTAGWLARRHPDSLALDWDVLDEEQEARLEDLLELLVAWCETPALDEGDRDLRATIRLLAKGAADGAFLVRRFEALAASPAVRQRIQDGLDLPFVLAPSPGGPSRTLARLPSRTLAKLAGRPVRFQDRPLATSRPDLAREVRRPPLSIRAVSLGEGRRFVDLAREAMVTRSRDLDAFMHADARDARLVDCGDGLAFACLGVIPERRLLLEAVYGFLTLKNGVPIGYVLASALFGSCEVAFNVFETFRGGESALVYVRALAMCRALFGADTFTIYPYQLGHENDEGLRSGAWWFYAKLGFRPRDARTLALFRREDRAIRRNAGHRSSLATLRRLAEENVYWTSGPRRSDVIGLFPLERIGLAASAYLSDRFGADRERGEEISADEVGKLVGIPRWRALPAGERLAFRRWAPLVRVLPGVERWSAQARRDLGRVVRAKGGKRESDFVRLLDAHRSLRRALCSLAGLRA